MGDGLMPTLLRALGLLCVFLLAACGNPDLSRDEAAQLIRSSPEVQERLNNIPILRGAIDNGAAQGLWDVEGNRISFRSAAAAEISGMNTNTIQLRQGQLRQGADITVDVTGMASIFDSETMKEAQFRWFYSALPRLTRRFAISGGDGRATFRLYDDGWRLERIDISNAYQPYVLSDADSQELQADYNAEARRVQRIEQERLEAEQQRQALADAAKTPSETIGTYSYIYFVGRYGEHSGGRDVKYSGTITLTDVGFTLARPATTRNEARADTYYFYDGYRPAEGQQSTRNCMDTRHACFISATSDVYNNATWGWRAHILLLEPFHSFKHQTPLRFDEASERDRFYADLRQAVNAWGRRNSALVNFSPMR